MKERIENAPCERGNDLVSFLYQELEGRELRDFEQHLSGCSSCSQELASFQEVRSSVVAWRQESLGINPATAAGFRDFGKPSAAAAIRQFFALSPVWLKGAVAFASLLFFAAVISLVMKSGATPPAPLVSSDKIYSEAELRAKVEAGVQQRLTELNAVNNPAKEATQPQLTAARQPTPKAKAVLNAKIRRAPLTRSEREQLAADLRLISPTTEDSDLDLLGEHINR
jgi:anti-sigma factor RsiW